MPYFELERASGFCWRKKENAPSATLEGVQLVYRPGARADVQIRHAGPVGFLAAKADALAGRELQEYRARSRHVQ